MLFYERVNSFHKDNSVEFGHNTLVNGGLGAKRVANNISSELDDGIDEGEQRPNLNGAGISPAQDFLPESTSSSSIHTPETTPPTSPNTPPDSPVEASGGAHKLVEAYLAALETYTSLRGTLTSTLFAGHAALSQVETDELVFEIPTTAEIGVEIGLDSGFRIHTSSPPAVTEPVANGIRKRKGQGKEASANGSAASALSAPLRKAQEEFTSGTTPPFPIFWMCSS